MRLVVQATGEEAKIGQTYNGHLLTYFRRPHKPSSSGKCSVMDESGQTREYYVGVLGLEWIEREDRA